MANILLRSPRYEYNIQAGSTYAELQLSVDSVLRYTIQKDVDADSGVLFEISELARDYLDVAFDGTYTSQVIAITGTITFYDSLDVQVGTAVNISHIGYDGYGEYVDGSNPTIQAGQLLQTNTTMYMPDDTIGRIASESSGTIAYNSFGFNATSATVGGQVVTIKRICEPKFTPILITFINKYGAFQDIWFFKKSTENIITRKESYKRAVVSSTGTYNVSTHSVRTLNVQGMQSMTVNTGFLDEGMNEPFKELLLSEQVWAVINNVERPIDITTSQLNYKTSLNDKLVDFTISFNFANDTINVLR